MAGKCSGVVLPQEVRRLLEGHELTRRLHPTDFGIYNEARGFCTRPDGADTHILMLCVGGRALLRVEGRDRLFSAGDMVLIPAGRPHSYGSAPGHSWSVYWTHFAGTEAAGYFGHLDGVLLESCPDERFNKALAVFRDYHNCLSGGIRLSNLVLASQLLACLLAWLFFSDAAGTVPEQARKGIERAVEAMGESLGRAMPLREMASRAGLSRPHFSCLFKKATGFSPVDYFNHLKARQACHLLDSTELAVGEVGERLGIDNPHYFSRMFSKIMGVSPRQYRNRQGLGNPKPMNR